MILRTLPVLALAVLATGCSSGAGGSSGSAATAAATMQPGKWEMKTEVLEMKVANMPAGMTMPKTPPQTATVCVTPDQAKAGPGDMTKAAAGSGCTFTKNDSSGGNIAIDMTCKTPAGTVTTKTTGTYSATEWTMESEANTTGANATSSKTRITARRVGDCDAK